VNPDVVITRAGPARSGHGDRPAVARRNRAATGHFHTEVASRTARATTLARNRHITTAGRDLRTRIRDANTPIAAARAGPARSGHGDRPAAAGRDQAAAGDHHTLAVRCTTRPAALARDDDVAAGRVDLRIRIGHVHAVTERAGSRATRAVDGHGAGTTQDLAAKREFYSELQIARTGAAAGQGNVAAAGRLDGAAAQIDPHRRARRRAGGIRAHGNITIHGRQGGSARHGDFLHGGQGGRPVAGQRDGGGPAADLDRRCIARQILVASQRHRTGHGQLVERRRPFADRQTGREIGYRVDPQVVGGAAAVDRHRAGGIGKIRLLESHRVRAQSRERVTGRAVVFQDCLHVAAGRQVEDDVRHRPRVRDRRQTGVKDE